MTSPTPSLPLGATAPDFSLADPAGRSWTLADASGPRGTLVAFVCNHCPYVKHVAESLGEAAARWGDAGVATVAINSNDAESYPEDRPDRMVDQARAWGWAFPYLVDADQVVARDYLAACTPDFFLLDAAGTLVYRGRFDGATPGNGVAVTGDELDAAVTALAAGAAIDPQQRPSVGCSIKWKPGNAPY